MVRGLEYFVVYIDAMCDFIVKKGEKSFWLFFFLVGAQRTGMLIYVAFILRFRNSHGNTSKFNSLWFKRLQL